MNKFQKGDRVVHNAYGQAPHTDASRGVVVDYTPRGRVNVLWDGMAEMSYPEENLTLLSAAETSENNAVSPNVYKFPNCEVRDISAHLTSFGGQAVQYVARATRLDGLVKGNPLQDIDKAIQVLQWERERLQEAK